MKVLVVGRDVVRVFLATTAMRRNGLEIFVLTEPEPRTRKQLKGFVAVVIVVREDDLEEQAMWQGWLKSYVFGNGISVNWSTYRDE